MKNTLHYYFFNIYKKVLTHSFKSSIFIKWRRFLFSKRVFNAKKKVAIWASNKFVTQYWSLYNSKFYQMYNDKSVKLNSKNK